MSRKNLLSDKAGPLPIRGGIDDGKMWKEISIPPDADPQAVGVMIRESFNEKWLSEFLKEIIK